MGRIENIEVFENTKLLCKTHPVLKNFIEKGRAEQKLYLENEEIPETNKKLFDKPANITVSKKRSLEAAMAYDSDKVCVHNFASATNPGGGVTKGSTAQEECICRWEARVMP